IVAAEEQAPALERCVLLGFTREHVLERLQQLKAGAGQRGMDDLLSDVASALNADAGEQLAQQVSGRFPVALVDEFQDTDPLQYRIFRRLYYQRAGTALFMIGDPKQAIYRFRGADIHACLGAARDCERDKRFTLDTNWRSTTPMVAAVNHVFAQHADPFLIEGIGFHIARAAGRADEKPLRINAPEQRAALTLVLA